MKYKIGQRIKHDVLGAGVIRNIEKVGESRVGGEYWFVLTVWFDEKPPQEYALGGNLAPIFSHENIEII